MAEFRDILFRIDSRSPEVAMGRSIAPHQLVFDIGRSEVDTAAAFGILLAMAAERAQIARIEVDGDDIGFVDIADLSRFTTSIWTGGAVEPATRFKCVTCRPVRYERRTTPRNCPVTGHGKMVPA